MKRAWRDNSPAVYCLGLGLSVGLLLPTILVPVPLTQVTTGWAILVVSIVGLLWVPVGDYVRRRITWLPDPPTRPITPRILSQLTTSTPLKRCWVGTLGLLGRNDLGVALSEGTFLIPSRIPPKEMPEA